MPKKILFLIIGCAFVAFIGCDEGNSNSNNSDNNNDNNNNETSVDKFIVPEYTLNEECSNIDDFCDGNKYISCKNGIFTEENCNAAKCVWVPDAKMAYCEDGELEECDKIGEEHHTCWDSTTFNGESYPATLTNEHCYETNIGNYYIVDDEDLYCKGDCTSSTNCEVEDD